MNAAPTEPSTDAALHPDDVAWSGTRLFITILVVFGLHIGLFFLLGDRQPLPTRAVKNAAAFHLTERPTEAQQLDDPTLFALPHPRGFAGITWLRLPEINFPPFRWSEPPRMLPLPVAQLGTAFLRLAESNNLPITREFAATPGPITTVLSPAEPPPSRTVSTLRLNGNLSQRPLRNDRLTLPTPRAAEGLTNTVVQVLVDERGQVVSATILPPGSGVKETDLAALKFSRTLRFKPVTEDTALTVGRLVFEWATSAATAGTPAPQ